MIKKCLLLKQKYNNKKDYFDSLDIEAICHFLFFFLPHLFNTQFFFICYNFQSFLETYLAKQKFLQEKIELFFVI